MDKTTRDKYSIIKDKCRDKTYLSYLYYSYKIFFTKETKFKWITRRSIPVGATSFCYLIPFIWGGCPMYVIQCIPSFMSDYIFLKNDSYWHPIDRSLALINSIFTITTAFWVIKWWEVLILVFATYCNYFSSLYFISKKNMIGFEVSHTIWHVLGSLSISYVTMTACGYQTSWGEGCYTKWVGLLYCNCY